METSERKKLLSLAYGYLGSLVEAEDMVQEALLRLQQADFAAIENQNAWLMKVVTRLSIDKLRSAQRHREVYPGEWLPEPVFGAPTAEQNAITQSRLSIGLLYLLEKLEAEQRIVFVLREVFEHSYRYIADLTGKSEDACRQLMTRARAALGRAKHAPPHSSSVAQTIVARFIHALANGDEQELLKIIAKDAVLIGDGGGKVPSILNPVYGADRIVRFFAGIMRKHGHGFDLQPATINSSSGLMIFTDRQLSSVAQIEIEDERIVAIYSVGNPNKLGIVSRET